MWPEFSKLATTSHASLGHIHCKEQSDEILIAFVYRRSELLLQNFCKIV